MGIFSSVLHNHVMVAELHDFYSATASRPVTVTTGVDISLHEGSDSSARWDPRGINTRRIRVVPDSPYFWVDAPELDQVMVIALDFKNIVNTKTGLDSKDLVYVAGSTASSTGRPALTNSAFYSSTQASASNDKKDSTLSIVSIVLSAAALVAMISTLILVAGKRDPTRVQDSSAQKKEIDPEDPSINFMKGDHVNSIGSLSLPSMK